MEGRVTAPDPFLLAAASTLARDALWRDPPPLAADCEHDLELLPVIEPRFTVLCRKCGGLDVEASQAIGATSADTPEYVIRPDSSVIRLGKPGPDPLAAFCYARLDEDEADALESKNAPEGAMRYLDADRWTEALSWQADADSVLCRVTALRSVIGDCEAALRYPRNVPLANLARRTLAGIASIWEEHPDYAPAASPG